MTTKIKSGVIADGAVGTTQLAGDSVTAGKIVDGAVGTSEIDDGAVGDADLAATLDLSAKTLTLPPANTPALTVSYTSPNQTITAAGALTLAHGLGAMPTLVQLRLKCLTAELGYSIGDEIIANPTTDDGTTSRGISIVPDATNVNVRFGSNANLYALLNKGTGTRATITNANWALIVKAWK